MDFSIDDAQRHIQDLARSFALERVAPIAREMDEQGEMPLGLFGEMGRRGLLGGPLPLHYGGGGWDTVSLALCYEELGRVDSSIRGAMTVHTSLVSKCILQWGDEEQKKQYLPRLATGEMIGCYCLTEPEAGSDAGSIVTTARPEGDDYVLNGEKIWITNGNIADVAIVFASIDLSQRHRGICAFLVPTHSPGFSRERMPGKELGHRASDHARIVLRDLRLPKTSLLGETGEGFRVAMSALDNGRLGVAAGALGVAQACLDASVQFAKTRRQFGQRIGNFEMVQATLADMAADVAAARWLVYHAAWLMDNGKRATREVSIAKLFSTRIATIAANEAVVLHGGRGYSNEYPVERYLRDIKGLQIYEGTEHIQQIVIARDLIGKE